MQNKSSSTTTLERIKGQTVSGKKIPLLLCEVFERSGKKLEQPSYEWMYAHGESPLHKTSYDETVIIRKYLESGEIIQTFEGYAYSSAAVFHQIQHIDNVKFGMREDNGGIVLYELTDQNVTQANLTDSFIDMQEAHIPAITRIDEQLSEQSLTVEDTAIQLRGGPIIRPIISHTL